MSNIRHRSLECQRFFILRTIGKRKSLKICDSLLIFVNSIHQQPVIRLSKVRREKSYLLFIKDKISIPKQVFLETNKNETSLVEHPQKVLVISQK